MRTASFEVYIDAKDESLQQSDDNHRQEKLLIEMKMDRRRDMLISGLLEAIAGSGLLFLLGGGLIAFGITEREDLFKTLGAIILLGIAVTIGDGAQRICRALQLKPDAPPENLRPVDIAKLFCAKLTEWGPGAISPEHILPLLDYCKSALVTRYAADPRGFVQDTREIYCKLRHIIRAALLSLYGGRIEDYDYAQGQWCVEKEEDGETSTQVVMRTDLTPLLLRDSKHVPVPETLIHMYWNISFESNNGRWLLRSVVPQTLPECLVWENQGE